MLTLIATPLGNLRDISPRAKDAFSSSDILLCEDTRHTAQLLRLLELSLPQLVSLHRFNEKSREDEVIGWLRAGKNVSLVSDAGTPGISDPGAFLVARCHHEGIRVTIVPGPCAFISAFAIAGSLDQHVQFVGFLPKKEKEKETCLRELAAYPGATVAYESPHRVLETLCMAATICPEWEVVLVRELTKLYEEVIRLPISQLVAKLESKEIKGEFTLIFLSAPRAARPSDETLVAYVASTRDRFSCHLKEAVEIVAGEYGVPQRELYRLCIFGTSIA